jgi:hypothetical protein
LSRRKYDIGYWLQFMQTGDPTFFHRGQAFIQLTEVETQHPPQVNVTSAYAGTGLDHTGSASSNVFWDSKHYIDANNNLVAKHDGSLRCTEGWGGSVWFPVYNASPGALTGGGASVNGCSDGQQLGDVEHGDGDTQRDADGGNKRYQRNGDERVRQ